MYLIFARDRYTAVTRDSHLVHRVADSSAANQYVAKMYKEESARLKTEHEARLGEWDQRAADLRKQFARTHGTRKEGSLGSRREVPYVDLTFPDGQVRQGLSPTEADGAIEQFVRARLGPRPSAPNLDQDFATWKSATKVELAEVREWAAYETDSSAVLHKLDDALGNWQQGAPYPVIAAILNRYAAQGWRLVSTAEDKGLYKGVDAQDESFPARIRFLLVRD